jgi:hypothetical protein
VYRYKLDIGIYLAFFDVLVGNYGLGKAETRRLLLAARHAVSGARIAARLEPSAADLVAMADACMQFGDGA